MRSCLCSLNWFLKISLKKLLQKCFQFIFLGVFFSDFSRISFKSSSKRSFNRCNSWRFLSQVLKSFRNLSKNFPEIINTLFWNFLQGFSSKVLTCIFSQEFLQNFPRNSSQSSQRHLQEGDFLEIPCGIPYGTLQKFMCNFWKNF